MNQGLSFFKPDLLEPGTTTATFSWAHTACNCEQFARICENCSPRLTHPNPACQQQVGQYDEQVSGLVPVSFNILNYRNIHFDQES